MRLDKYLDDDIMDEASVDGLADKFRALGGEVGKSSIDKKAKNKIMGYIRDIINLVTRD